VIRHNVPAATLRLGRNVKLAAGDPLNPNRSFRLAGHAKVNDAFFARTRSLKCTTKTPRDAIESDATRGAASPALDGAAPTSHEFPAASDAPTPSGAANSTAKTLNDRPLKRAPPDDTTTLIPVGHNS
jgi:hypothetical protein